LNDGEPTIGSDKSQNHQENHGHHHRQVNLQ